MLLLCRGLPAHLTALYQSDLPDDSPSPHNNTYFTQSDAVNNHIAAQSPTNTATAPMNTNPSVPATRLSNDASNTDSAIVSANHDPDASVPSASSFSSLSAHLRSLEEFFSSNFSLIANKLMIMEERQDTLENIVQVRNQ